MIPSDKTNDASKLLPAYGKNYREIYKEVLEYLKTKNSKWNDFTEDDIGAMLVHTMAYLASNNNYYLSRSIQELHPDFATEDSSKRSIIGFLGYKNSMMTGSVGLVNLYFLSNMIQTTNESIVIPKYIRMVTNMKDSNNGNYFLITRESTSFNMQKLESLKLILKPDEDGNTPVIPPGTTMFSVYLQCQNGRVGDWIIEDPGANLQPLTDVEGNIHCCAASNPDIEMIVTITSSGIFDTIVPNSSFLESDEETATSNLDITDTNLLFGIVSIPVIEGQYNFLRISEDEIVNSTYTITEPNVDPTMITLSDAESDWTMVDNIVFDYDPYGLNSKKYSVRSNSDGNMVIELPQNWEEIVPYTTDNNKLSIKYTTTGGNVNIYDRTYCELLDDVFIPVLTGSTSLKSLLIESQVYKGVNGGLDKLPINRDLMLARTKSRRMDTIITVPDLAAAILDFNVGRSAAYDINDEDSVGAYMLSKLGYSMKTYEMYYSAISSEMDLVSPSVLDYIQDKLVKSRHIFTKFVYVEPTQIPVRLDISIESYELIDLDELQTIIANLYKLDNPDYTLNYNPEVSDIIRKIHNSDQNIKSVQVTKSYDVTPLSGGGIYYYTLEEATFSTNYVSRSGGYIYE